jgi:UTP--glucose-1-phosphate uridylyltransferase
MPRLTTLQVCERTASDKKGGHLCRRVSDGKLMLRESAMCPDDDKKAFEDIGKHKYFNTNNLWVNLDRLLAELQVGCHIIECGPSNPQRYTVNQGTPQVLRLCTRFPCKKLSLSTGPVLEMAVVSMGRSQML